MVLLATDGMVSPRNIKGEEYLPEEVRGKYGELVRLNLPYHTREYFSTAPGLAKDVIAKGMPVEMIDAARNFHQAIKEGKNPWVVDEAEVSTDEEEQKVDKSSAIKLPTFDWDEERDVQKLYDLWHEFVGVPHGRLYKDVHKRNVPFGLCHLCPGMTCAFLAVFPLVFIPLLHMISKKRVHKYDASVRQWQEEFNKQLEPYGLGVKTRSHCYVIHHNESDEVELTRRIAFAVTPAEVLKLRREDHITGEKVNNKGCCGVNMEELAMIPPFGL
ncbi:unnamed protein product [Amoebophrya sp. A120]|nr:unnamed protein product [Amoebophrya sp. A120]|eukprot:GSA120T00001544001.1